MKITINPASDLPIYQQIFDAVSTGILKGEIQGGETLPTIRFVAQELRISVIGVKRAWEELERAGFIHTAVGRGSFAAELTEAERAEKRRSLLRERLQSGADYCRALGVSAEEAAEVLREIM